MEPISPLAKYINNYFINNSESNSSTTDTIDTSASNLSSPLLTEYSSSSQQSLNSSDSIFYNMSKTNSNSSINLDEDPYIYLNKSDEELEQYLNKLSYSYYNTDNELVSDVIYDDLRDALYERNPNAKIFSQVGYKSTNDTKLPYHMYSLDKVTPAKDNFNKYVEKFKGPYLISDKADGISCLIIKNDAKNIHLYLRSTAEMGTDISYALKYINLDTSHIPKKWAIRGELIISKENFKQISNQYKSPRMAVNGIIKRKLPNPKLLSLVDFISYSIVTPRFKQSEQHDLLINKLKLQTVPYCIQKKISIDILIDYFKQRRDNSNYIIDGIVVCDDSKIYEYATNKNPEYQIAFKSLYKEQYKITKVINVDWNVSRLGYIKPRIQIEPVFILDATVNYATAHNARYIVDNKIGPGAEVKISKSGDIIPFILDVMIPAKKPQMPDFDYEWNETNVDIKLIGNIKDSNDVIIQQLKYSMKVLQVNHFGEKLIARLVTNCNCKTLADIINLPIVDIQTQLGDNNGPKIYNNLITQLQNVKLNTMMIASNCFEKGIGIKRINLVINNIPDLLYKNTKDIHNEILNINGFDEKTSNIFVNGLIKFKKYIKLFNKTQNKIKLDFNIEDISEQNKKQNDNDGLISNEQTKDIPKRVVLTGFRNNCIKDYIEKHGGNILSNISTKTDLLIIKDNDVQNNLKYKKAKDLGIKIMTSEQFYNEYLK